MRSGAIESATDSSGGFSLRVAKAEGRYDGMPAERQYIVTMRGIGPAVKRLTGNGVALAEHSDMPAFLAAHEGWLRLSSGSVVAKFRAATSARVEVSGA